MWTTRPRSEAPAGLAWWRAGSGTPLVLLHGVGLRAEAWAAQVESLSADFSVYAIDLPGHGQSAAIDGQPSLADYSRCIASAIDTIGQPVLLAGHSMGAMIALDLAIQRPELCRGLIALNAIYRRNADATAAVRARAAALPADRCANSGATLRRWFGNQLQSNAALACQRWLADVDLQAYRQAYTVFASEDGPQACALATLACPALFITGSAEPNSTAAMSRTMAAITPGGQAQIVEGAAHMMPMTHAAEVNAAVSRFHATVRGIGNG